MTFAKLLESERARNAAEIGKRLRAIRTERGLTQGDVAESISVARESVGNWETGARVPSRVYLLRLAHALRVTVSELTGRPDIKPRGSERVPPSMAERAINRLAIAANVDGKVWVRAEDVRTVLELVA